MDWKKFKSQKEKSLLDAVAKGEADKGILKLLDKINLHKEWVCTSSCFGRIVLFEFEWEKNDSNFYRKWHRKVKLGEVKRAVDAYKGKKLLWFKLEPFIIHVAAKDVASAKKFLDIARGIGIKRGGIQTIKPEKIMVEIQGHCQLVMPAKAIADWKKVVWMANKMFDINLSKLRELKKAV
jgi:tRNA(Phe) wybutosine-synthesizing methylase Tyw3